MVKILYRDFLILEVLLGVAALGFMVRARRLSDLPFVFGWLSLNTVSAFLTLALLFFRTATHLSKQQAYDTFCYWNWFSFAAESCLQLLIIYNVFTEAMRPFEGLRRIGKLIFAWGGVVSIAMALAFCAGPEVLNTGSTRDIAVTNITGHLQQCISILTVCLLAFVGFATRPLGLNFRSRLFGITLGLGVSATTNLVSAAWYAVVQQHTMYSPINVAGAVGYSLTLLIWGIYFALPEPEPRLILLPTTSPFFHWNRISEILGDAPGHVAVAGLTPEMLAPAEIAMMEAALPSRHELPLSDFGAFNPLETQPF